MIIPGVLGVRDNRVYFDTDRKDDVQNEHKNDSHVGYDVFLDIFSEGPNDDTEHWQKYSDYAFCCIQLMHNLGTSEPNVRTVVLIVDYQEWVKTVWDHLRYNIPRAKDWGREEIRYLHI